MLSALPNLQQSNSTILEGNSEAISAELRECRKQRDELEVYLQHILQDLEDKTPLLEEMKRNYDALKHNYEQLVRVWSEKLQ